MTSFLALGPLLLGVSACAVTVTIFSPTTTNTYLVGSKVSGSGKCTWGAGEHAANQVMLWTLVGSGDPSQGTSVDNQFAMMTLYPPNPDGSGASSWTTQTLDDLLAPAAKGPFFFTAVAYNSLMGSLGAFATVQVSAY